MQTLFTKAMSHPVIEDRKCFTEAFLVFSQRASEVATGSVQEGSCRRTITNVCKYEGPYGWSKTLLFCLPMGDIVTYSFRKSQSASAFLHYSAALDFFEKYSDI